jgi:hypothetical protein
VASPTPEGRASFPGYLSVGDIGPGVIDSFLHRFDLISEWIADGSPITASFWGDPEAGIVGQCVFIRADTPVHSMLHEVCHIICMNRERRLNLDRDAGGDDHEESAVCYLQIVLAEHLEGVGQLRLMQDMDAWGYSFRLGSTQCWFENDAEDARSWLVAAGLLDKADNPQFRLRGT